MDSKEDGMPSKGHDVSGKRPGKFKDINQYMDARFFRDNNLDTKYLGPLQKQLLELKKKRDKGIPPSK